mmetsp:Transcript_15917/g.23630  ORF Transcript_15917/g.23630 Transcript_15917/m.23630 type:complete len:271 (-) Transcript_15917:20-832(-)
MDSDVEMFGNISGAERAQHAVLSSFYWLRNDLTKFLTPEFDVLLGEGAREQVTDIINERFNMSGDDPDGRKVGLLDVHQLMCMICDPFFRKWRSKFWLQRSKAELVRKMIDWYVPLDADGSDTLRREVLDDFEQFDSQQGRWFHCFADPLLKTPSQAELESNNSSFGTQEVWKYAEETGLITKRLQFFEVYAGSSVFYQKVAKPLLSMGTVGSMDVERMANPLKNTILTKKRNRLKDDTGVSLLRAHQNLHHIMAAKKLLGKRISDSLQA